MASSYSAQMRVHRPQVDAKADGHLPIAHRILRQAQQCQGDPSLSGWQLGSADAEAWIAAWEREAEARGLPRTGHYCWEAGQTWIAMRRLQHRTPPG
jgi:hypothetical protein